MPRLRWTFLWCGVLGTGAALMLVAAGATAVIPQLDELIDRGGASEALATAVLAADFWVLALLCAQLARIGRESRALAYERARHSRERGRGGARNHYGIDPPRPASFERTEVHEVVTQLRKLPGGLTPGEDQAAFLTSGHSALRAARSETPYTLLRALVWALPALGFIGTAAEMAHAIGGLSGAVRETGSYADLAGALVPNVIEPLAGAFGITLFALGSSVVGHVLVTLVHTREERLALDMDRMVLERFGGRREAETGTVRDAAEAARELETAMTGAARSLTSLNKELGRLSEEAEGVRLHGRDEPTRHHELIQQLIGIGEQLSGIRTGIVAGLEKEMVLSPVLREPSPPGQNGQTLFPRDGQA